ncbi:hypothetical protein NDN94_07620 [Burkholderia glumae]|uniref:hypothetical protein n=1 Tax=Burkholderia glumae TaxID=337 RepID=UPI0020370F96|nr:hypothetical protein [Burkholderia glumae]MCM2537695.1 hypothetical protein [Burkholderia glumae]
MDKKMPLSHRLLCECLRDNPGVVAIQAAELLGLGMRTVASRITVLVEGGYIERGVRTAEGYPLKWSGKRFPPSSDFEDTPDYQRRMRLDRELAETLAVVVPAMHAMVKVGRAQA